MEQIRAGVGRHKALPGIIIGLTQDRLRMNGIHCNQERQSLILDYCL